jgi:hypothetical protein
MTGAGADPTASELRLLEVLERWDRRLEAAVAAWERLTPVERQRRETDLDAAGEPEEWVRVLWAWWTAASAEGRRLLEDDVRLVAPVLRGARAAGLLSGDDERAAAARHLLDALQRMEAIFGPGPSSA